MEQGILEALKIGGTPGTLILGGVFLVRWMNFRFKEIDKALNGIDKALNAKQSKEMCTERHEETCRRVERLEKVTNGE